MWRRNRFPQNEDSDQSLSEEDDLDGDLPEDCISLGGPVVKKGEVQVLSQLEMLRDASKFIQETKHTKHTSSSQKRQADLCIADDVEFPVFAGDFWLPRRASTCNSDEEIISDNEVMVNNMRATKCIMPGTDHFQKLGPFSSGTTQKDGVPENRDLCIQDDVEFPVFANEVDLICLPRRASTCNSDEEIVSDNEVMVNNTRANPCITPGANPPDHFQKLGPCSSGITRKDGDFTWPAHTEPETLVFLNNNAGCSSSRPVFSKTKRSCKGGRGKARPKFSIHNLSPMEDLSNDLNIMNESRMSPKGKKMEESKIHAIPTEMEVGHDYTSMAELLDCFQDKNDMRQGSSERYNRPKGRSGRLAVKRRISSLGHRNMDDYPEGLDSGSSNDDEDNHQNLKFIMPESKRKTMTDQFQEAFGAASMNNEGHMFAVPRNSGIGLYGKLQRVMQSEKERDLDFLNRLQMKDEGSCIDVKILSRCLEAKLTVCCCSSVEDDESSEWVDDPPMMKGVERRTLTIIFSSRICSDVELEVGKLIRVHPPWREVQVMGKGESTILSTYFSQI